MKKNVCALVGGLLCLVSVLMSYVTFKQFGIKLYSIRWMTAAKYLNHNLYFIPVIGVLMIVSGFVRGKVLQAVAALAGVVMAVYYAVVFGNMLGVKSVEKLLVEGPQILNLLAGTLGMDLQVGEISTDTLAEIVRLVKSAQHIGQGYWFFCAGTLVSIVGLLLPAQQQPAAKKSTETTHGSDIY